MPVDFTNYCITTSYETKKSIKITLPSGKSNNYDKKDIRIYQSNDGDSKFYISWGYIEDIINNVFNYEINGKKLSILGSDAILRNNSKLKFL